jgi:hypothetical protein
LYPAHVRAPQAVLSVLDEHQLIGNSRAAVQLWLLRHSDQGGIAAITPADDAQARRIGDAWSMSQ